MTERPRPLAGDGDATASPIAGAFDALFTGHPLPMWVFDPASLRILDANAAAIRRYGYSLEEFRARTIADLHPPDEQAAFQRQLNTDLAQEVGSSAPSRHWTRDGTELWVQVIGYWTVYRGRRARLAMALDVTEDHIVAQRIQESEEYLRQVIEHAGDAFILSAPDGSIVMVNEAACSSLGYSRKELLASHLADVVVEVRRDQVVGPRLAALGPGESMVTRATHRRKDGTTVPVESRVGWVQVHGRPMFLAIARDLTDRLRAEELVRDSERRYRDLVDNAPIGVYRTTPDGRILFVNRALARMIGFDDPAELYDLNLENDGLVASYDRTWFRERLERDGEIRGLEAAWRRREGTLFFGRENVRVVRDEPTGAVAYYDGTIEDVSERVAAELARQETEESYRQFVERASIGIARTTPDGRILTANSALARMLGYGSEGELREQRLPGDFYLDPADRGRLLERFEVQDTVDDVEIRVRRRDGREITLRVSGRAIRDAAGEAVSYEFIIDDVTQERILAAQLRQAQKMEAVGQLTGGIAHDFNNILTVVLANADLLAAHLETAQPELRNDVVELQRAARRGAEMIRKLLAFSRNEQLELKPLALDRVVGDVGHMLRRLLPESIEIRTRPEGDLPYVSADPGAVDQMIMNLATNARDAMPEGGVLTVEAQRRTLTEQHRQLHGWGTPGPYVCLTVSDTGCGMDEATLARVFEPFFTTKPTGRGTGLGMAMIYGLMKQHGGYVDVESCVDDGTTVSLYFPAVSAERAAVADEAREPGLPRGTETILLVEDEEVLRRAAERLLRNFGYSVLHATDGEQALELLAGANGAVDLVITDVVMPRMGGRQLHRIMRDRGLPTRVLFTSGYAGPERDGAGALDPDTPFLRKPWTLGELARAVRAALDDDPVAADA